VVNTQSSDGADISSANVSTTGSEGGTGDETSSDTMRKEHVTPNSSLLAAPCHSSQLKESSETKLLNPLQIANNIKMLQQEKQQAASAAAAYKSAQASKTSGSGHSSDAVDLERERVMKERERAEKNSSFLVSVQG